ncbi:MAG: tetratricopeptide repeat protein [Flavobacteriaceae bacterium]|nr:tetratricopeptide repeat protein [Flavobacteriaceae bacterium]
MEENFALSRFESMLRTNSVYFFDSSEFEEIIQHYIDTGKFSRAKKAISLGLQQYPNLISLKLLNAELLILENHIERAFGILTELQHIEPKNEEIYYLLAQIFSKRENHQQAIDLLLKANAICEEEDFDILLMLGMEYLFVEQFQSARIQFKKCLAIENDDYSILYNIIYCYEMEKLYEDAIVFLQKYIDEDPYNEVAWHQLGRQFFTLKRYKEALEAFDYSVLIDEHFVGGYLEKAKTLEELHRYKEAIENYKTSISLDDPTAFAYYRIASCYKQLDELNLAILYYGKAIYEDPSLEKAWLAIISIYSSQNKLEEALDTASKAIDSNERNPLFWRKYGTLLLKVNQLEKSVDAFKNCILLKDFDIEVWTGLSDCFIKSYAYKEAEEILLQAIKFFDTTEIQERLALVRSKLKR